MSENCSEMEQLQRRAYQRTPLIGATKQQREVSTVYELQEVE